MSQHPTTPPAPPGRAATVGRWLILLLNLLVCLLLLAAARWELAGAMIGAFGPPWWLSLPLVGVLVVAAGVVSWWRASRSWPRRIVLVSGAATLAIGMTALVSHLTAYRISRVSFAGPGVTIAAWVYAPRAEGRVAAVVVVPGSAPLKGGFYDPWADQIVRRGLMVIVPDKRGVGGTGGEFERNNNGSLENLSLLASDVVAAVDYAARRDDVMPGRVGILGLSQAGWVGPIAAVQSDHIHFMAFITAPTVSLREEGIWSELRGDDQQSALLTRAAAEAVLDSVTPGGVDARSRLAQLRIPALWLFGADDNSIPTRRSAGVLDSLRLAGHPFDHHTFPEAGHLLIHRPAGTLVPRIASDSWPRLLDWLGARSME